MPLYTTIVFTVRQYARGFGLSYTGYASRTSWICISYLILLFKVYSQAYHYTSATKATLNDVGEVHR